MTILLFGGVSGSDDPAYEPYPSDKPSLASFASNSDQGAVLSYLAIGTDDSLDNDLQWERSVRLASEAFDAFWALPERERGSDFVE